MAANVRYDSRVHFEADDDEGRQEEFSPDVVYKAFGDVFFRARSACSSALNEMRNSVLTDATAREQATRHFFGRALRQARERGVTEL